MKLQIVGVTQSYYPKYKISEYALAPHSRNKIPFEKGPTLYMIKLPFKSGIVHMVTKPYKYSVHCP